MEENQPSRLELELEVIELRHQWEKAQAGGSGLSEGERQEILERYIKAQSRLNGCSYEDWSRRAFPEAT